jgi:hypothetical protein
MTPAKKEGVLNGKIIYMTNKISADVSKEDNELVKSLSFMYTI